MTRLTKQVVPKISWWYPVPTLHPPPCHIHTVLSPQTLPFTTHETTCRKRGKVKPFRITCHLQQNRDGKHLVHPGTPNTRFKRNVGWNNTFLEMIQLKQQFINGCFGFQDHDPLDPKNPWNMQVLSPENPSLWPSHMKEPCVPMGGLPINMVSSTNLNDTVDAPPGMYKTL